MTSHITDRLAEFVVDNADRRLTPAQAGAATMAVVDSIGVIAAGLTADAGRAMLAYARGLVPAGGPTRWWGAPAALTASTAAMTAATMGHSLDFDDALPGAGHPSVVLLAALLAAGPTAGPATGPATVSGADLLSGFVVGYEVNARLSRAVNPGHYAHGWHTTSTIGTFGAIAAVCALRRLKADQVRTAFGIGASLSGGLQRNFGTGTKPFHSGLAAGHGLLATDLCLAGLGADQAVFDGGRGYLDIYAWGEGADDAFDHLGESWAITDPGPTLKKYPCALELYRVVDATLEAIERLGVTGADLARIDCVVPPGTTGPLLYDRPTTPLEAKFCLPYAVAAAALDGGLRLDSFSPPALARPEVRALMERVSVREDVACRPEDPTGRHSSASSGGFVDVRVTTSDGRGTTARVGVVAGSPGRPLTPAERRAKWADCLQAGGRAPQVAAPVFDALQALAELDDVDAVLRVLTPPDAERMTHD